MAVTQAQAREQPAQRPGAEKSLADTVDQVMFSYGAERKMNLLIPPEFPHPLDL